MPNATPTKPVKGADTNAEAIRLDRLARSLEREADNLVKEAENRAIRLREHAANLRTQHEATEQALRVLALIKDATK